VELYDVRATPPYVTITDAVVDVVVVTYPEAPGIISCPLVPAVALTLAGPVVPTITLGRVVLVEPLVAVTTPNINPPEPHGVSVVVAEVVQTTVPSGAAVAKAPKSFWVLIYVRVSYILAICPLEVAENLTSARQSTGLLTENVGMLPVSEELAAVNAGWLLLPFRQMWAQIFVVETPLGHVPPACDSVVVGMITLRPPV
jgi:hypothetical protein